MTELAFDSELLETADCPMCSSGRRTPTGFGRHGLGVVRCDDCGLFFLSPRFTERSILKHYQDISYFEGTGCGYSSYQDQEESLRLTFRRLLRVLARKGMTGGSVVEVGCGHGFFLDEARPYFKRRVGTDLSNDAAAHAARFADQVWVGGVEAIPTDQHFDLAVAVHVIEHVYDPRSFARQLASHLKDGGHLVMATPDAGSFWFHVLGERWPSFKFPEHVAFFDRRSLTALFVDADLGDVKRISYPHAFPLSEILRKAGLPPVKHLRKLSIWIPATTLALAGRVHRAK